MLRARETLRRLAQAAADESEPPESARRPRTGPAESEVPPAGPLLEFGECEPGSHVQFTREQRRSRRKRSVRPRSISTFRLARRDLEAGRQLFPDDGMGRPARREDCKNEPRPCPFVSCRYHLYLDVSPKTGSIKLNFPDLEVWELGESCALDVAERGGVTVEHLGAILNVTRERIRQLEIRALTVLHEDLMKTA